MENKSIKKGKVMPGDELAVIEEFESGKGTYEIKGQIRASVLGETTVDNKKKFIQINKSIKRSLLPKENDQVEGILETEKFLRIRKINGEMSFSYLTGLMERTKMVDISATDYIRATVISLMNGVIHTAIRQENDGVIKSKCLSCAGKVIKVQRGVKCIECGLFRFKKLSSDFK